jgi:hypothetical protein
MALRPRLTTGLPFSTRQRSAEKFPAELAADPTSMKRGAPVEECGEGRGERGPDDPALKE